MVDTIWPVNAVANAPLYSGRMRRQANSVLLAGATAARPLGARSGVRPGTSTATVTATSTTWSCGSFAGAIDAQAAAEAGPYAFAFDAATSGPLDAANASNPRVDIIYVQIDDPSESDGTSTPAVRRGYLAGTAAAIPVAPATPARSFVIAQINVPKSGGGSPTVTWVAPYAVAAGGVLPVPTKALLTAITGYKGQYAEVTTDATATNNGLYKWSGSAWSLVVGDTGWIAPTLLNGWVQWDANYPIMYRLKNGQVFLRGIPKSGSATTIFTLPVGFRPPTPSRVSVRNFGGTGSMGPSYMTVWSDGTVQLNDVLAVSPSLADIPPFLVD